MKKILLIFLALITVSGYVKPASARLGGFPLTSIGFPFGTALVTYMFPCPLSGNVIITVMPTIPPAHPPGPFVVPPSAARYAFWIYPPVPGTRMLGTWMPGGVCIIPFFPTPIVIPAFGTVTGYGSASILPGRFGF